MPSASPSTASLSTANAIKQTLSPLTQHRQTMLVNGGIGASGNGSGNTDSKSAAASAASTSLGTYQFPSSTLKSNTASNAGLNHHNHHESIYNNHHQQQQQQTLSSAAGSPASLRKSMSPARTGNISSQHGVTNSSSSSSNLPPTNVARNMLYQSESSYSLKSSGAGVGMHVAGGGASGQSHTQNTNSLIGSSANNYSLSNHHSTGVGNHIGSSASASMYGLANGSLSASSAASTTAASTMLGSTNPMSIYGTLPKSLLGSGNISGAGAYGSTSGSDFEMTSAMGGLNGGGGMGMVSGGGRTAVNTSNGGYNTLGSYRVQYSSTNPFLPSFNPTSNGDGNSEE